MFHFKLLELESELLAKELSQKPFDVFPPECEGILGFVEQDIGVTLANKVPINWKGWLCYRRHQDSLIICRGRAFAEGAFTSAAAGLDVVYGLDTITEYERGFDVSPLQDLDHLLINFGVGDDPKVFLWYGENLAAYRLIFMANVSDDPHLLLSEAVVEACVWILKRPKDLTLSKFLEDMNQKRQ